MTLTSTVVDKIVVDRPILDVYEFTTDIARLEEWSLIYSNARLNKSGFDTDLFGIPGLKAQIDRLDYVPGRYIAQRSSWPMPYIGTWEFDPVAGGTLVTASFTVLPFGYFEPLFGAWRPLTMAMLNQSLNSLKLRLESRRAIHRRNDIFFCYRREVDGYVGSLVFDSLTQEFGQGAVFRDLASMPAGERPESLIESVLRDCIAVVVLIGPDWENQFKDESKKDWVLLEIETALKLEKWITPLLVRDDPIEKKNLPDPARELIDKYQFQVLRHWDDFSRDIQMVIDGIWRRIDDLYRGEFETQVRDLADARSPFEWAYRSGS